MMAAAHSPSLYPGYAVHEAYERWRESLEQSPEDPGPPLPDPDATSAPAQSASPESSIADDPSFAPIQVDYAFDTLRDDPSVVAVPVEFQSSSAASHAYGVLAPLDRQIATVHGALADIQARNADVSRQLQVLQAVSVGLSRRHFTGTTVADLNSREPIMVRDVNGDLRNAKDLLQEVGLLDQFATTADPNDQKMSASSVSALIEQLQTRQSEINNGNQTRMIQLQDLMSQRSLMLQIETNMLASREQTARKVAENIR